MCMSKRDSEKKPFQYNSYDSIFLEPGIFFSRNTQRFYCVN